MLPNFFPEWISWHSKPFLAVKLNKRAVHVDYTNGRFSSGKKPNSQFLHAYINQRDQTLSPAVHMHMGNIATAAVPCWSGWENSSTSSSSMNTFSTPLVWRKVAVSTIAAFNSLINKVEHNQMTAMQPRSILDRWRCLPGTPNRPTRIFRSLSVRSPQTFRNLSSKETFLSNSFEGVADTGNNALNWSNVLLVMNSWHRCLYLSTSFFVVVLLEIRDTRTHIIVCNNDNYLGSRVMRLVMLVCVCVPVHIWPKKQAVWGLTTWKSPVSVIYCSLINKNGAHYARQFLQGKKLWSILLTERDKGSGKLYYGKPCFV